MSPRESDGWNLFVHKMRRRIAAQAVDYRAVELRVLAHAAHERNRQAHVNRLLAELDAERDPVRRRKLKNINFMLLYGASLPVISRALRQK